MTRGKVLLLHGFGSSDTICTSQTPNLRSELQQLGLDVEYPSAPHRLNPEDFPFADVHDCTSQPLYCWWHFLGESSYSLDAFFEKFKTYDERDEVIGVIGISQGGAASNLIASHALELFPNLRFVVGFGGFIWPTPWDEKTDLSIYKDEGIFLPYLTVYGSDDVDVVPKESLKVHDILCKGEKGVVVHDKGHTFADGDERVVSDVITWLKQFI